jgi:hypothetical protein
MKTIDIPQSAVVTGMSAICQVSAATAGGDRTGASGHPAGSWLPCAAEVGRGYGRRRVEKGWKNVRTQRTRSSPGGPRQSMGGAGRRGRRARGGVGGAFLAGKRGYCRWARRWGGPYIGWSRVLDPDCVHFHSRIAKIFLGFWRREREGGLRVRENALNEGHQACRTTKPIDEGFSTRGTLFYCPPQVARGNFV